MRCLKCGRELKEELVFCQDCQAEMEQYPVKPGTPILLPSHPEILPVKKKAARQRRALKPEEQAARLRSNNRLLLLALAVLFAAFLLTAILALRMLDDRDNQAPIGQNYSSQS